LPHDDRGERSTPERGDPRGKCYPQQHPQAHSESREHNLRARYELLMQLRRLAAAVWTVTFNFVSVAVLSVAVVVLGARLPLLR
jgi:hypothetical protein